MQGDGKTHYDHDFDGSTVELGGCHQEIRNKEKPTFVRVTYLHRDYLQVLFVLYSLIYVLMKKIGFIVSRLMRLLIRAITLGLLR